jgi:hypothetical protein
MSTTAPHVYTAINAVQAAMAKEGISKDRKNSQQGYSFRGIDDVYASLSPHLAREKLCILPRVTDRTVLERETKSGGNLFYTTLKVEFDFVSATDGSKHTICTVGEAMDSADKSSNKAMSAAYKYACFLAFAIPTEGDNEADAHTPEVAPKREPRVDTPPPIPYPEAWATWTLNERGSNRAHAGQAALKHWWSTLTAEEKKILKPTLDGEWKAIAEKVKAAA